MTIWQELCAISQRDGCASGYLQNEARRLIDCFWAYSINQQSEYLEAKVYGFPNGRSNVIIAQVGNEEDG